jgi:glycerate-2-kinase
MVHLIGIEPGDTGIKKKRPGVSEYENLVKHNAWLHTICVETSHEAALSVIDKWDVNKKMPESIVKFLESFDPGKDAVRWEEYSTFDFRIFGIMPRTRSALVKGMQRAAEIGYTPHYIGFIVTEASSAGQYMGQMAVAAEAGLSSFKPPCALFTVGELLVTCGDDPGVGGRNQEYCLSGSRVIAAVSVS